MFALSLFLVNSAYMHLTVAYKTMLSAMLPEMSLASKLALYDARCTLTLRTSEPTDVPVSQDYERRGVGVVGHRTLRVCTFFLSMPFGLQEFRWTILLVLGVCCCRASSPLQSLPPVRCARPRRVPHSHSK